MRSSIVYTEGCSWKAILASLTSAAGLFLGTGLVAVRIGHTQTAVPGSTNPTLARFEVASVKPCNTDATFVGGSGRNSPGRLFLNCQGVRGLILRAYSMYRDGRPNPSMISPNAILGGPAWIDSDRYTIEAKAEPAQPEGMMMGPMLRALLEERFRLRIHRDPKALASSSLSIMWKSQQATEVRRMTARMVTCAGFRQGPGEAVLKWGYRLA